MKAVEELKEILDYRGFISHMVQMKVTVFEAS